MKIYSLTGSYKSEFEGGINLIGGEITSNEAIILKGNGYVHITQSLFTVPLLSNSEANLFGPDYGNIYYDTGSEDYRAYSSRGEWESMLLSGDVDDTTIGYSGSSQLEVKDGGIDHDQLAPRFTAKQDIATTSGTINLDASSYGIFELTSALTGATTLNIQNIKKGQVIDILVTGAQTITMADDFTTSAINQAGSGVYDGASSNHIQVVCVDDNDSDAILIYSVATYTSDTDPA